MGLIALTKWTCDLCQRTAIAPEGEAEVCD